MVITGMGAVTPLGLGVDEMWENLVAGRSGIGRITHFDPTGFPSQIAGEVKDFDPTRYMSNREARRMARFSQLAVAAALQAVENAGLNGSNAELERVGVLLGNGNGGLPTTQEECRVLFERGGMRIKPFFFPMVLPNMAAANVSRLLGFKGYNSTVTTACAASNQAIGEAMEVIRRGVADVMVSGGTEAGISEIGLAGFCVMRALSTQNGAPEKASRPFDAKRDGFIASEGAAVFVLESLEHALRRDALILTEVSGFGSSSDAFHLVQPDDTGDGAFHAMSNALEDAGIHPHEVAYINAHGTSTPLNDAVETLAIKRLLGDYAYKVPISSTKSMVGHGLGAAGAVEAIACVKSITEGVIHPTINYEFPDPECDLDYVPNKAREQEVNVVLSNSFGFGGQNACLVFRRFEG